MPVIGDDLAKCNSARCYTQLSWNWHESQPYMWRNWWEQFFVRKCLIGMAHRNWSHHLKIIINTVHSIVPHKHPHSIYISRTHSLTNIHIQDSRKTNKIYSAVQFVVYRHRLGRWKLLPNRQQHQLNDEANHGAYIVEAANKRTNNGCDSLSGPAECPCSARSHF